MKLLLGTRNEGKQHELTRILSRLAAEHAVALDLVRPDEVGLRAEPEESGATFEENSLAKARFYRAATDLPTLADDGGLEIPSLAGEPGVRSRRWPGYAAGDEALIAYCLERLAPFATAEARRARLRTCLTYVDSHRQAQECGSVEGSMATEPTPRRVPGYPYRALFVVDGLGKYYDELSTAEHRAVNHRERALTRLFGVIEAAARGG